MLRTREFDQRHADGDRPRRWVALPPVSLLSPASSPPRFCRPAIAHSASRDNSKPHAALYLRLLSPKTRRATEVKRRQNSPGDKNHSTSPPCRTFRLPPCLPKTNWQTWQTWQTCKTSQFSLPSPAPPAVRHLVLHSVANLSRPCVQASDTPNSLPPNAFRPSHAILSPRSPFATKFPRATVFECLGRACSQLLKNGTWIDAD